MIHNVSKSNKLLLSKKQAFFFNINIPPPLCQPTASDKARGAKSEVLAKACYLLNPRTASDEAPNARGVVGAGETIHTVSYSNLRR